MSSRNYFPDPDQFSNLLETSRLVPVCTEIVADLDTSFVNDRLDGPKQMLIGAHASRDAVHDNTDFLGLHRFGYWNSK